jgi:hypothetical protein
MVLANSLQSPSNHFWRGLRVGAAASAVSFALALSWLPGLAYADGDPASDVLAEQSLFLPPDAGISLGQQAQLNADLDAARRSGYQIRVAIIASSADLGSVTALWREPQDYAQFLGMELELVYRGPLLVIMPNGFGAYHLGPLATVRPALADVRGHGLGGIALSAIERLAAASGHAFAVPNAPVPSSRGTTDTVAWIAFAIGGMLIAAAWTVSLRVRPLQTRARNIRSG